MTARTRIAAASLGLALVGGALVASPANAQQREFTNPLATPVTTDTDVTSVAVDANRSTVSLRFRTQNLSSTYGAIAYLTERRVASGGAMLVVEVGVEDGVVRTVRATAVEDIADSFEGTLLPAGAARFARSGDDLVFTIDTRYLLWDGPVHAGGALEPQSGGRFVAESFSETPVFFGPVTTQADPTTTTLTRSASRQVYGQARSTVLTAKVPAGVAGSVVFRDGAAPLGIVKQVGGTARISLPRTLRAGTHTLTATFVPTDRVRHSTSTAATWVSVSAQATRTTVRLSKAKQKYRGTPARLAVTVSGRASGTVTVLDGRRRLKVVRVRDGRATYALPRTLKAGNHRITAVFRPTTPGTFTGSTSRAVRLTVTR